MKAILISTNQNDYELLFNDGEFYEVVKDELNGAITFDITDDITVVDEETGNEFMVTISNYLSPDEILQLAQDLKLHLILQPEYIINDDTGEFSSNFISKRKIRLDNVVIMAITPRILEKIMYEKGK